MVDLRPPSHTLKTREAAPQQAPNVKANVLMEFRAPPYLSGAGEAGPVEVTSFIGRRAELAEVKRLLATHRLVTMIGVGGVGKTRIAAKVAAELRRRFADGAAWVELADLRDPSLIAQTIEDRLVIAERVGHEALATVVHHLRDRSMLLVLDNAEHVLAECAQVVQELVRSAPGLRVLITSRQVLNIPGEHLYPVSPFPVPTEEQSAEAGVGVSYPSLALFQERAGAFVPGFAITTANQKAVSSICRKLEGIPLAIELATVKLRVLSVEQLCERLDARLEALNPNSRLANSRHASLQAAIDWSFELCTPREQLLWARASTFAGGFDVEAAEACCGDDELARVDILETVAGLVDKSILTRVELKGRTRFKLLEPLREHGLAELARRGETESQMDRHLSWCASLVDEACMQWFGPAQERWCVTLQLEKANIRAAAEYCIGQPGRSEEALKLVGDPWFLWVALFLDEGRHWLDRALARSSEQTPARAKALATAGYVASLQGRAEEAEQFLAQSLAVTESIAGPATHAYAMHIRGLNLMFSDPEASTPLFREALALYNAVDDVYDDFVVGLRIQYGLGLLFAGEIASASVEFAWCRELCTVTGERWLLSYALFGEAFVKFLNEDLADALSLARDAVSIKRFFGDALGLAVSMDLIGWISAASGDAEQAATVLGAASRLWDGLGAALFGSEHWLAPRERAIAQCVAQLGSTRFAKAFDHGHALPRETGLALALGDRIASQEAVRDSGALLLTPREREIADLVADGLSNKAIAQKLVIAQRTAECHVENILTKFGYHSRSQIAAWVAEHRSSVV
jgi:predicted ATPase/DNA-binding CsgD family transcriptional regulator